MNQPAEMTPQIIKSIAGLPAVYFATCLPPNRDLRAAACSGCIFLNKGDGYNQRTCYECQHSLHQQRHTIPILCPGRRQGVRWGGITDLLAGACIGVTISYYWVEKSCQWSITSTFTVSFLSLMFRTVCHNTYWITKSQIPPPQSGVPHDH
jgi:hypothetical protein